ESCPEAVALEVHAGPRHGGVGGRLRRRVCRRRTHRKKSQEEEGRCAHQGRLKMMRMMPDTCTTELIPWLAGVSSGLVVSLPLPVRTPPIEGEVSFLADSSAPAE